MPTSEQTIVGRKRRGRAATASAGTASVVRAREHDSLHALDELRARDADAGGDEVLFDAQRLLEVTETNVVQRWAVDMVKVQGSRIRVRARRRSRGTRRHVPDTVIVNRGKDGRAVA